MARQGFALAVNVDDLTVDDEGRVSISDPITSRMIAAAVANRDIDEIAGGEPTTNNCHGGNCAKGCGKEK